LNPALAGYVGDEREELRELTKGWDTDSNGQRIRASAIDIKEAYEALKTEHDPYAQQQFEEWRRSINQLRAGPAMPDTYYPGYGHVELKKMVDDNLEPAEADQAGRMWHKTGKALFDLQGEIHGGVVQDAAEWSGATADLAHNRFNVLSTWTEAVGRSFQLAGNRMAVQSVAAEWAKKVMPPPVAFTEADAHAMINGATDPEDCAASGPVLPPLRRNARRSFQVHPSRETRPLLQKFRSGQRSLRSRGVLPPPSPLGAAHWEKKLNPPDRG